MSLARLHGSSRTARWWRAAAIRVLAFAFALSVSVPVAGLASDLDYHARGQHAGVEFGTISVPSSADAADPGLSCHLHCGCHQLAAVAAGPVLPVLDAVKRVYVRVTQKLSSLAPNRLLRPPASA